MPVTSGQYNFQTINIETVTKEAFERIGIMNSLVVPQQIESAIRSMNFLLTEWAVLSINLWTLQSSFISLFPGQATYELPIETNDIIQANMRLSTRQLNGVAAASEGNAENAFNNDPLTACTQTNANGNISYDYGVQSPQIITFLGIQSNINRTYEFKFQCSIDNTNWNDLQLIPKQPYKAGITAWFEITSPVQKQFYRILGTNNAVLDIRKLYFNNNIVDNQITGVSRNEYFSYSNPTLIGAPSVFYFNRQITTPTISLYVTPSAYYNVLSISWSKMMEDIGGSLANNTPAIPARFYQAFIWGVSWLLAVKFAPDRADKLEQYYIKAFKVAEHQDSENTPIQFQIDLSSYMEN